MFRNLVTEVERDSKNFSMFREGRGERKSQITSASNCFICLIKMFGSNIFKYEKWLLASRWLRFKSFLVLRHIYGQRIPTFRNTTLPSASASTSARRRLSLAVKEVHSSCIAWFWRLRQWNPSLLARRHSVKSQRTWIVISLHFSKLLIIPLANVWYTMH